jgi:hypothetical protein
MANIEVSDNAKRVGVGTVLFWISTKSLWKVTRVNTLDWAVVCVDRGEHPCIEGDCGTIGFHYLDDLCHIHGIETVSDEKGSLEVI